MITLDKRKRLRVAILLFTFCAGLYFFTYSGTSISEDELILFDGVHSFAQHGNFWLDYANSSRPVATYPNNAPLPSVDSEPMQIYAALPLFGLAEVIPGWGLMQTVWLFNILITALTVVIFFYYAIALGYSDRVAIAGSLLLAGATMLWPYSKTFFREPLAMLLILFSAYALEQARRHWHPHGWRWLTGSGAALIMAVLTKSTAILIFPALIAIAVPSGLAPTQFLSRLKQDLQGHSAARNRRSVLIGGTIAITVLIILVILVRVLGQRYGLNSIIDRFWQSRDHAIYALISYLASPGRSIWAFSPILLIGFLGVGILWRARLWRHIAVPVLTLAGLALGYAAFQNIDWYGGLAWGPRYLLVVIPFLALWILPVLTHLPRIPRLGQIGIALLIAISVGVQILGALPIKSYYDFLGAENVRFNLPVNTINGWQAGTWQPQYIPSVVLSKLAIEGKAGFDLAWEQVSGAWPIAILCIIICTAALVGLIRIPHPLSPPLRTQRERLPTGTADSPSLFTERGIGGEVLWLIAILFLFSLGLTLYETDPRYADDPSVRDGLTALNRILKPGDGVLLNDQAFRFTFMNFYKSTAPIMVLPDSPGETVIPGKPPLVTDPDGSQPDSLVAPILPMMLARFGLIANRWWLVTEFNPADPNRQRVTERCLTRHYFPIGEPYTANRLRIVGFSAQSAPPDSFPPWPHDRSGATFGDRFTLIGYDMPKTIAIDRVRGTILPLSLLWQFTGWPTGVNPFDYSLNVSLIDPNGVVVQSAQQAGTPLGSFGLTSTWQAGSYYRDNHGLTLPPTLPAGTYHLWLIWYDWRDNTHLPVSGADHLDLTTITVQ